MTKPSAPKEVWICTAPSGQSYITNGGKNANLPNGWRNDLYTRASPQVPPRQPTEAMMNAAVAAHVGALLAHDVNVGGCEDCCKAIWQAMYDAAPPRADDKHALTERDTKLLACFTPEWYAGDYPPYWNLTMVRMKGDVVLTVRLPTQANQPPGQSAFVRFPRDMWREFMRQIEAANKVYEACDSLDAML